MYSTGMLTKTLLALPIEVLQLVIGYLDSRGLSGFSRSSKGCRAAASNSLFTDLNLTFVDIEKLESDLDRWVEILDFNGAWKAIRRLEIHAEFDVPPLVGIPNLGDNPLEPFKYYADDTPAEWTLEHDRDFAKLARFIVRLPTLMDVVWACSNQLPPCILSALEDENRLHRPRLHLHTFRLRSLLVQPATPIEVHAYDKRLARSPVLYSLASRHSGYDMEGNSDFNLEAIIAMTASLAPNLKEISLCRELPGSSIALLAASKVARQNWQGDELGEETQSKRGSLTSLVLTEASDVYDLRFWAQKSNFTKLRTLKVFQNVPVEVLCWLTETRPFSDALEEMALEFGRHTLAVVAKPLRLLFDSLPPLKRLRLSGLCRPSVLEVIFRQHGDSLRTLFLARTLTDDQVLSIRHLCPNVQQLALSVPRSAGDEKEIAYYHAIGALRHLRHLTLTLHICRRLVTAEQTSTIRAALIDAVVDESLAAAIFRTISAASPSRRGTLESLRLLVQLYNRALDYDIESACKTVARSWLCERNFRDDALGHSCIVTELGREDREDNLRAIGQRLAPEVKAAIRDLWPEQAAGDWTHDWRSWPLQDVEA